MPPLAYPGLIATATEAPAVAPEIAPRCQATTFWKPGLGLGASVILALTPELDQLSKQIARLPPPPPGARPMVSHYLFMVKTLAAAWRAHSRPALDSALRGVQRFGESFTNQDAPLLGGALLNLINERNDGGAAARLLDGLVRRLAAPVEALQAIERDFTSYLAQMAAASTDLEADTAEMTERMQSGQLRAFELAQRINHLQNRIAAARAGRHAHWLAGPQAEALRKQIVGDSHEHDTSLGQLDAIRAEQAQAMDGAVYLQALLPSLAGYLGAFDRIGAGIRSASSGALALRSGIDELRHALRDGGVRAAHAVQAHAQLPAALANWRLLDAAVNELAAPP